MDGIFVKRTAYRSISPRIAIGDHDGGVGLIGAVHEEIDVRNEDIPALVAALLSHMPFDHTGLHQSIAEVLASGGPIADEFDAATEVMDLLVRQRLIPPPPGYDSDLEPIEG